MLILILVISLVGLIFGLLLNWDILPSICGFMLMVSIVGIIWCTSSIVSSMPIDEKIAMYEEENEHIETDIAAVVKQYMDHESTIFENATVESPITLVSLYPELKSDTLVQSQIDIYVENNNAIKELREDKINVSVSRWWLYFGR